METTQINFKLFNLIIFPDWNQSEESLYLDLEQIIKAILTNPDKDNIALLIDSSNLSAESELDPNLILSGITLDLLFQEDLDTDSEPEIIILENLDQKDWQNILPRIQYRIKLTAENEDAIEDSGFANIPILEIDEVSKPQSLKLEPSLLLNLANQSYQQGRYEEAVSRYQRLLESQTGDAEVYFSLSECLRNLKKIEDAIAILQQGISIYPTTGKLHFYLITILQQNGYTKEAISSAETAAELVPNEYVFHLLKNLLLPIVYDTPEEIEYYRQRFIQKLDNLIQQTSLETPEDKINTLIGIGSYTNFYLAYQAHNVVESQSKYGNLLHQILAANYPQLVEPRAMPPLPENGKIRVGYISNYLHSYSGTLWLTGWLRYSDKSKFEIYSYYTGNDPDLITQQFRDSSDVFHHIPHNLEAVSQQIIADKLHILVFPEIGMDAPTIQIAALRLAPIQCSAWGHPVTSGLPTIDYYLSSELMEPENAQQHYSETLIRLPNIGVAYPKPIVGKLTNTRSDFNLREDAVIYLCCQAPFKYLPQYDYILAEIALRVPQAQFIFPRGELLRKRLNRAFAKVNLEYEDYCLFLPIPTRQDYIAINFLSDVFLDTFTWSGGNTSLEAIACNLPIVTCPGEFMRGLHADSFLKMLGVTDTIAKNEVEYIDIAVKLGLELEWRCEISERMSQRQDYLFDDRVCVAGLENFYQEVTENEDQILKENLSEST
ncbi:tetratricopeptide repeat protein [Kamptonema animale CS-326]|jgi:predicted O-linked N-acetylglucosamine transferase (SPINDLY family)|uniref:O-linked N-acetylglucosamine transferase, SPINDLY family protein n=1 Tax=Kamptonema animale TaxID=92934 RepID=UPI00232E50EE|nr:tetratricopeptide repeat protein [Kamptonema animale]MDB9513415.1 tetratricopeptide repeat protein [Kamptonema animale CS-326]